MSHVLACLGLSGAPGETLGSKELQGTGKQTACCHPHIRPPPAVGLAVLLPLGTLRDALFT